MFLPDNRLLNQAGYRITSEKFAARVFKSFCRCEWEAEQSNKTKPMGKAQPRAFMLPQRLAQSSIQNL